jgi:DNA adenine methylase
LKSLLRYPGGKTRAIKWITPYFPEDIKEMVSPFFGGGSIEIYYASQRVLVHGYEIFEPLVNFWQHALDDPEHMAETLESLFHPCTEEMFRKYQEKHSNTRMDSTHRHYKQYRACMYYALNRSSFSGATTSGGYSKEAAAKRYTQSSIDRLRNFSCDYLTVKEADFKDSLAKHDDDIFIYADPPYAIDNPVLYGDNGSTHKGFDHFGFAREIKKKNRWIISYNDSEHIRNLYKGYQIIETGWSYGMHGGNAKEGELVNKSSEILILNGIDPDHVAAANQKVKEMREAEAQKKRKAAKRKTRKKDKESRQARWERKLSTFKKEKENKNEILFIDD